MFYCSQNIPDVNLTCRACLSSGSVHAVWFAWLWYSEWVEMQRVCQAAYYSFLCVFQTSDRPVFLVVIYVSGMTFSLVVSPKSTSPTWSNRLFCHVAFFRQPGVKTPSAGITMNVRVLASSHATAATGKTGREEGFKKNNAGPLVGSGRLHMCEWRKSTWFRFNMSKSAVVLWYHLCMCA